MSKTAILYCEADPKVLSTQARTLTDAGHAVVTVLGRAALEMALKAGGFDIVILGHTLSRDDRHHLPYLAKKSNPAARVIALHASARHPQIDVAIDSRWGDRAVLDAIAQALLQPVAT